MTISEMHDLRGELTGLDCFSPLQASGATAAIRTGEPDTMQVLSEYIRSKIRIPISGIFVPGAVVATEFHEPERYEPLPARQAQDLSPFFFVK